MGFKIFFTLVCVLAAVAIAVAIVNGNRTYDGKTSTGWWISALAIGQIMITGALSVWWPQWFLDHQWIMNLSVGVAIWGGIFWVIGKTIATK